MSAVLHLTRTYFTATPLTRALFALGLVLLAVGMAAYIQVQAWTLGTGMRQSPLWFQSVLLMLPWLGLILLVFSSALLPLVVERLALGRLIRVLPGGRAKLVLSAFLTAGLLALVTAVAATAAFLGLPGEFVPERLFVRSFLVGFVDFGFVYLALWVVAKMRGIWLLMGSVLIILGITVPLDAIGSPGLPGFVWVGLAGWAAFAMLLLSGARIRHAFDGADRRASRFARVLMPPSRYAPGAEIDLLLGTTRPWIVALGQVVPIGIAAVFIWVNSVWLFYLTLFSALSGAATSHAAARSRRLWLRFDWTRAELFRRVESAYWRYNAYSLAVLLLLFVALGTYLDFSTRLLALGLPLLVLGAAVSFYLGLVTTRGMGAFEAVLAIATTLLLMATAVLIADEDAGRLVVIELEVLLAALALLYRVIAKSRWSALDWMVCRGETLARRAG